MNIVIYNGKYPRYNFIYQQWAPQKTYKGHEMTNCIIFAFRLFFRRWRSAAKRKVPFNGYIVVRLSRVPWGFIHVFYGRWDKTHDTIRIVSYKPIKARKSGFEPVFRGLVKRGDH